MRATGTMVVGLVLWGVTAAAQTGAPPPAPAPAPAEEAGRLVDQLVEGLRSLRGQIERYWPAAPPPGPGPGSPAERPLISLMLERRAELGLSADQVTKLEGLRTEFTREAIRRDAELRIAELDLATLLGHDPVDLGRAEAKVRELAQLQAELRIARLKVLERGKALLTAEQRTRLQGLLARMPAGPGGRGPDAGPPRPDRM